jgi:hypothetical protein
MGHGVAWGVNGGNGSVNTNELGRTRVIREGGLICGAWDDGACLQQWHCPIAVTIASNSCHQAQSSTFKSSKAFLVALVADDQLAHCMDVRI